MGRPLTAVRKVTGGRENLGRSLESCLRSPGRKDGSSDQSSYGEKREKQKVVLTRLGDRLDMGWRSRVTKVSDLPSLRIK